MPRGRRRRTTTEVAVADRPQVPEEIRQVSMEELQNVPPAVAEAYVRIAAEFRAHTKSLAKFYHWIGGEINRLLSEPKDRAGDNPVKVLSNLLDIEESVLYKAAQVNQAFTEDELLALIDKYTDSAGKPRITWSHIAAVASLPDESRRELLEEIGEKGLSISELNERIKEYREPDGRRGRAGRPPLAASSDINSLKSFLKWLKMGIKYSEYWLATLDRFMDRGFPDEETAELFDKIQILMREEFASTVDDLFEKVVAVSDGESSGNESEEVEEEYEEAETS